MKHLWAILTIVFCSPFIIAQETIAVVDFDGKGVSDTEASALSDELEIQVSSFSNRYTFIERNRLGELLEEQGLQQSGCVTSECAVEIGKLLGADKIIIGSISKVGDTYSVTAKIILVESGAIINSVSKKHSGKIDFLLTNTMRQVAIELFSSDRIDSIVTDSAKDIEIITLSQAKQFYDMGTSLFIDARKGDAYDKGNIKGSIQHTFLMETIFQIEDLQNQLYLLIPIIIYCEDSNCTESQQLANDLDAMRFKNLYILSGGYRGWVKNNYPITNKLQEEAIIDTLQTAIDNIKLKLEEWRVLEHKDPLTGSRSISFTKISEGKQKFNYGEKFAILVIGSVDRKLYLHIDWGGFITTGDIMVNYRIGHNPSIREYWDMSTDHEATFSKRPVDTINRMKYEEEVLFRVTPYGDNPITHTFNIAGLDSLIDKYPLDFKALDIPEESEAIKSNNDLFYACILLVFAGLLNRL